VGTTSLRTIESLYWIGVKFSIDNFQLSIENRQPANRPMEIGQWEVYDELKQDIPAEVALQSLLDMMEKNKMERLLAKTQIIIAPGYTPRIVSGLITNFHQPGSTLLLLVAALIGENLPAGQAGLPAAQAGWRKVYEYALSHDFRFLSYGDGCLIWKKN
jgi:S-adenosylmethionine:tRNA ribosyltransferase-isomerase